MILGSASVALADDMEQEASGTGSVEYVAKGDVFDVVFPTVSDGTFNYILDPDGLIAQTGGDKYSGKTFESGKSLYFLRSTASNATPANNYMNTSDEITVVNKSTQDIDLTVTAKVAAVDGIEMATSSNAFRSDGPALYLAVSGKGSADATATEKAITTDGIALSPTIAADTDAYEVVWNATTNQYEKDKTTAAQADNYAGFKSYTFQLTGACNNHAGWSSLEGQAPSVDLVWSVKDFTVKGPKVTLSTDGLITISGLTEEANVKNGATDILVGYANASDGNTTLYPVAAKGVTWITDSWNATTGGTLKVQLKAGTYSPFNGKSINVSVKLSDGKTITTNTTVGTVAQ